MSFSMILFNLIPLRPFDGYQLLHLVTSLVLLGGGRRGERVRRRILSGAHLIACLLTLFCAVVGLAQLLSSAYSK